MAFKPVTSAVIIPCQGPMRTLSIRSALVDHTEVPPIGESQELFVDAWDTNLQRSCFEALCREPGTESFRITGAMLGEQVEKLDRQRGVNNKYWIPGDGGR